jgi:hypothetical protein
MALTEDGKEALDEGRVRTVMLNLPDSTRAFRTGWPRAPDA